MKMLCPKSARQWLKKQNRDTTGVATKLKGSMTSNRNRIYKKERSCPNVAYWRSEVKLMQVSTNRPIYLKFLISLSKTIPIGVCIYQRSCRLLWKTVRISLNRTVNWNKVQIIDLISSLLKYLNFSKVLI